MGEWIKKMWYKYTMEYYSAMRKKELLQFGTTWMNLEGVMLSEIIQIQKDEHCMISLYVESKKQNSYKQSRVVATRGWGFMEMGRCWSKSTDF